MKSELNFIVKKDGQIIDMHEIGVWVSSFHIYSPNVRRSKIYVPGRPGAITSESSEDERYVRISLQVHEDSMEKFDETKHKIYDIFFSEEPFSIIRDAFPNLEIIVQQEGYYDPFNLTVSDGDFDILLSMADPFLYGPEKTEIITDAGTIQVEGTAPTYPNIKVKVKEDTTFLAVSNGDQINMIGNPADVTVPEYVREERVFWDQMGTLVGWADTTSIEEGENTGVMRTDGYSFFATDYGTGSAWHGPALKKSIGTTLQDFQIDALVRQIGSHGQVGSVEIALLDVNNRFVAKLILSKRSPNNHAVWARLRVGNEQNGHNVMNSRGAYDWVWQHFDGMLRLSRVGSVWEAYVAKIENGKHHSTLRQVWEDTQGLATAPIAQVQVQLWQFANVPTTTTQRIDDIKIFKINNEPEGLPYVALKDDVVEFDHENDIILRNGEDIRKEKAFIGEYFPLKSGSNALVIEPAEAIENTEVRWRDRWR